MARLRIGVLATLGFALATFLAWLVPAANASDLFPVTDEQNAVVFIFAGLTALTLMVTLGLAAHARTASDLQDAGENTSPPPHSSGRWIAVGAFLIGPVLSLSILSLNGSFDSPTYCESEWKANEAAITVDRSTYIARCQRSSGGSDSYSPGLEDVQDDIKSDICADPRNRSFITDWDEQCG